METITGFGDVYNGGAGDLVATRVRYSLRITYPAGGQLGRVDQAHIDLDAEVARLHAGAGPNDKPLTLRLDDGRRVDFLIASHDRLNDRVTVRIVGGVRAAEGGA
jgi:hypothetical protein